VWVYNEVMKVALVTGASRGLGKAFAEFLAKNEYLVYAGVRDLDAAKFSSNDIKPVELDVTNDRSISKAAELIRREHGSVDLLVNNAGVNKDTATAGHSELVSDLNTLDRDYLLKMFNINAISPLMVIKQIVTLMARGGYIINISSARASFKLAESDGRANYGYKASKAALNMLTQALVLDLPSNVFAIAVHPGNVQTDMNPGGSVKPTQAAAMIYESVIKNAENINGKFVKNDGSPHIN